MADRQVTVLQPQARVTTNVAAKQQVTTRLIVGQGPAGRDGVSGETDKHFEYTQSSAADTWVVEHGMGKYPSVVVVDSAGSVVEGSVEYDSINRITLEFSSAFAGVAYLN